MRLSQLNYFRNVVQTMNMTQSARELHISQPSISRSIRELEDELGTPLFDRHERTLRLTSQGRYFYQVVKQALTLLEQAKENVKTLQKTNNGVLTFKMRETTPLLIPFFNLLRKKWPHIKMHVLQSHQTVDSRPFDFQLVSSPLPGQNNQLLIDEEILLVTSQNNHHFQSNFVDLKQLNNLPLIQLSDSPFTNFVSNIFSKYDLHPNTVLQTGDRRLMLNLVSQGFSYCLMPSCSWQSDLKLPPLNYIHIKHPSVRRKIYLSYPEGPRTSIQQEAAKLMVNYCHKLQNNNI